MKPARTAALPLDLGRLAALVGAALLAVVLIGSPALAQVPSVDDTVGGVVGGVTGGTGSTSGGSVGDTVGDVGGSVGDTVGDVGGSVGDTVGDVGGSVGDTVGDVNGSVGDTVKDVTGAVGGAVKDTTGSVGDTVKDTSGSVGNAVDGATDSVLGDDEGRKGDKDHGSTKDGNKEGNKDGRKDRTGDKRGAGNLGSIEFGEGALGFGTQTPQITLGGVSQDLASNQVAAFAPEPLDVAALAEAAVEAIKRFAFPILLSILVAAFMLVQDRVDRKDPKLALAAVDSEQDWLSFA